MAKKILVFLSRPRSPLPEMQDFATPDGASVQGALTNDAPLRYLLRHHPDTEELLCVTTPESTPTFQRLVSLLEADGYCGQCTKLLYDGTANFEQSVLPTVSTSLQPGDAVLLDITGGFRNAMLYLTLICRVLSYRGIRVTEAVYSNWEESRVVDATPLVQMFDLIGGMQELTSFGSIRTLQNYYASQPADAAVTELLDAMEQLKESIDLCRSQRLSEHMKRFSAALESAEQSTDPMLQTLLPMFRKKFGTHMEIPQLIRWCIESQMLQQALTICEEFLPDYLYGYNRPIQRIWALPVMGTAYESSNKIQLKNGILKCSARCVNTPLDKQKYPLGYDWKLQLHSVQELRNAVADCREALMDIFAGRYCNHLKRLPGRVIENLSIVANLAFGPGGVGPYRSGWESQLPSNRVYLKNLCGHLEEKQYSSMLHFMESFHLCKEKLLGNLLEIPRQERYSRSGEETFYGQSIRNIHQLLKLFGYESHCEEKELQKLLCEYHYLHLLRNMINHANDSVGNELGLKDCHRLGCNYGNPATMSSKEIADTVEQILQHLTCTADRLEYQRTGKEDVP